MQVKNLWDRGKYYILLYCNTRVVPVRISEGTAALHLLCTSHLKPTPHTPPRARAPRTPHQAGIITSYSPAYVSLGGGENTRFHFFVV